MQVAKNVAHHLNLSHILNLMVTDSSTTFKTKRLGIDPKARLMQVLSLDEAKPNVCFKKTMTHLLLYTVANVSSFFLKQTLYGCHQIVEMTVL